MKLGIILQTNKQEQVWNVFRLGITALKANHQVEIFLLSEGSELESIPDTSSFDISVKVKEFKELKGDIYASSMPVERASRCVAKKKAMFVLFPRCQICSS